MPISATRDLPLDAHSQVRQHIGRITPLREDEESVLWLRTSNDLDARDRLVEGYQPLVATVARQLKHRCHFLDLLDLMQEGSLGIIRAIEARDRRSSETPIRVWVARWIRGAMLQAIYYHERGIRLPDRVRKRLSKLNAAQVELLNTRGCQPSVNDLAARTGFAAEDVTSLLLIQAERVVSLDAGDDAEQSAPEEEIAVETIAAHEEAPESNLHTWLHDELSRLPERAQLVIRHRYGFEGQTAKSTREVASLLGLSQTMVQEIDRRVRLHLRVALGLRRLSAQRSQVA